MSDPLYEQRSLIRMVRRENRQSNLALSLLLLSGLSIGYCCERLQEQSPAPNYTVDYRR